MLALIIRLARALHAGNDQRSGDSNGPLEKTPLW